VVEIEDGDGVAVRGEAAADGAAGTLPAAGAAAGSLDPPLIDVVA